MATTTLMKESMLLGLASHFRDLIHYHHGREYVAGGVAESSTARFTGSMKGMDLAWPFENAEPAFIDTLAPRRTHLVQQAHTCKSFLIMVLPDT